MVPTRKVVGGQRVGLLDDPQPQVGRIDRERFGDLVELNFLAEAALRRAMARVSARTAACS